MRTGLTKLQSNILDANNKLDISWLFEIDKDGDGDIDYYWSTKAKTWNGQVYTYKVMDFSPIQIERGRSEFGIQAPSTFSFTITNSGTSLRFSDFSSASVTVRLIVKADLSAVFNQPGVRSVDVTTASGIIKEAEILTFNFDIVGVSGQYQTLTFECRDWLSQYLEGYYPKTKLVVDEFDAPQQGRSADICVPLIFGKVYAELPMVSTKPSPTYHQELSLWATVTFTASTKKITTSDATAYNWPNLCQAGDTIVISGIFSAINNTGTFTVASVDGTGIVTNEAMVNETATQIGVLIKFIRLDLYGMDISFSSVTGKITKSGGGFSTHVVANSVVLVDGSASNDGLYFVSAVTDTELTVSETLTTEAVGASIYISRPNVAYLLGPTIVPNSSPSEQQMYYVTRATRPKEFIVGNNTEWHNNNAILQIFRSVQNSTAYYAVSIIAGDSNNDGVLDTPVVYASANSFAPAPIMVQAQYAGGSGWLVRNQPGDILSWILQDMGVPASKIDSTTLATIKATHVTWGLYWGLCLKYYEDRRILLARLLAICHVELIVRDKIYFKIHSKTSQRKIEQDMIIWDTFSYRALIPEKKDGGYIAQSVITTDWPYGGPEEVAKNYFVSAKGVTTHKDFEILNTLPVKDINNAASLSNSIKLGTLYYQRKFLPYAELTFQMKGKILQQEPDDIITIMPSNYMAGSGYEYDVIIDSMTINKDLLIDVACTRFSQSLDDWEDIVPATIMESPTDRSLNVYSPVISGPDAKDITSGNNIPNALAGALRIGTTGNYIHIDPVEPLMKFIEGGITRLKIGDLATDDWGIQFLDHDGDSIFKLDGSGINTFSGWVLNGSSDGTYPNSLSASSGLVGLSAAVTVGNDLRIWAGHATPGSAPFRVYEDGSIVATSATISGVISAATIDIGGDDASSFHVDIDGGIWSGASIANKATAPFRVSNVGAIVATSATITGTINATAGYFGDGSTRIAIEAAGINVGNTGSIRGGQTAYDTGEGFWMGYATAYKLSIGNSAGNKLTWDGSALSITGSITATTGSIGGFSIGTFSITSTLIGLHSAGYTEGAEILLGHATLYASAKVGLKADGSGKLASGNISWTDAGAITIAGSFTSTATITGGTIQTAAAAARSVLDSSGLSIYDATTQRAKIGSDGSGWLGASDVISWTTAGVTSVSGFTAGSADMTKVSGGNTTIVSSGATAFTAGPTGSPTFTVTQAGIVTATSGYIGGAVNGWAITAGLLTAAGTGIIQTSASASTGIKINSTALYGYNGTVQTVNIATDGSGWFGLTAARAIEWTTAGIVTIADWTVSATRIASTNVFIDQAGQYISMGATPPIAYGNNVGAWLGVDTVAKLSLYADANNYFQWNGALLTWKGVNSSLDASGNITATGGTIGGFTLSSTALYAGAVATRIQLDTTAGIHCGATAFADAPFSVSLAGALKATSGTIGGWSINATSIYTGTEDHSGYTANAGDITIYSDGADSSIHAKNFYIDTNGNLTATSVTLTGSITATSGAIGGWDIVAGYIYNLQSGTPTSSPSDGIVLASGNEALIVYEDTEKRIELGYLSAGIYGLKGYATNGMTVMFELSDTQTMIAGFSFDAAEGLYAGTGDTRVQMKPGAGIWCGETAIGDAEFSVTNAGVIKAVSGTIGGCALGTTSIGSTSFTSGPLGVGWNISNTGVAEFQNATIRGILRTSVFEKDTISAVNGIVLISKADVLASDMTALDSSTLTITGETSFVANEVLRIKDGVDDEWMLVTNAASAPTYTVTRDLAAAYAANTNPVWKKGTAIVSLGVGTGTKTGFILMDSSSANSPFIDIYARNSNTYSDYTQKVRLGWLQGIVDADVGLNSTDVWGLYSTSVYLKGVIVANTGYIGGTSGWVIAAGKITSTGIGVATAAGDATYAFWAGNDTPASAEFSVTHAGAVVATSATISGSITSISGTIGGFTLAANTLSSGTDADYVGISSDGTNAFWAGDSIFADAEFSVTAAGALKATSATITGAITANTGYIGGTSGWVISAGYIKDVAGIVGLSAIVTGGDDIRFWAGHATPGSAPFRVTEAGVLIATSATIGGWTVNSTSIYTGTEDHSGYTTNAGDITIYSDGSDSSIHAKNFYIDITGTLYAQNVNVSGYVSGSYIYGSSLMTKGTYLSVTCGAGDATLNVGDTTDFAASGTAYFIDSANDRDAFTYTGKTGTTLTDCYGVLAHTVSSTNRPLVVPTVKGIYISDVVNEMRFWGDRGDGTYEELANIGIKDVGITDNIVSQFGTFNSEYTSIATYSNGPVTIYSYSLGIVDRSSSGPLFYSALNYAGSLTARTVLGLNVNALLRDSLGSTSGSVSLKGQFIEASNSTTNSPSITINEITGLHIQTSFGTQGAITTAYGIYINSQGSVTPTNNYAIYQEDSTAKNYFAGNFFIGDTTNANCTLGLTINQEANDNEIFSLKSSDIAHGITDSTETDTYFSILKDTAVSGGAILRGFTEATKGLFLQGYGTTADTTISTTGRGPVCIVGSLKSGTGATTYADGDNLVTFNNHGYARIIIKGNGTFLPTTDVASDLGSSTYRWANIYTADLHLKNDEGDWTIQEGQDDLFLINNKTKKRYSFMLKEIE